MAVGRRRRDSVPVPVVPHPGCGEGAEVGVVGGEAGVQRRVAAVVGRGLVLLLLGGEGGEAPVGGGGGGVGGGGRGRGGGGGLRGGARALDAVLLAAFHNL